MTGEVWSHQRLLAGRLEPSKLLLDLASAQHLVGAIVIHFRKHPAIAVALELQVGLIGFPAGVPHF